MTLDLRDELEEATSALEPPSDLASRARVTGQRRLVVRRRRNAISGVAVVALIGVGIANIPTHWPQTTGRVQIGSGIATPDPSAMAAAQRQAEAQQRCQAALALQPKGTQIRFVSATTVAAIRTHRGGPAAVALAGKPWASLNGGDTAAWCTLQTAGAYKIIAATWGGASITFVTSQQPLGDPGPEGPAIP
jgi:hypothetical protein